MPKGPQLEKEGPIQTGPFYDCSSYSNEYVDLGKYAPMTEHFKTPQYPYYG